MQFQIDSEIVTYFRGKKTVQERDFSLRLINEEDSRRGNKRGGKGKRKQ
jgi:hypothetical protein